MQGKLGNFVILYHVSIALICITVTDNNVCAMEFEELYVAKKIGKHNLFFGGFEGVKQRVIGVEKKGVAKKKGG